MRTRFSYVTIGVCVLAVAAMAFLVTWALGRRATERLDEEVARPEAMSRFATPKGLTIFAPEFLPPTPDANAPAEGHDAALVQLASDAGQPDAERREQVFRNDWFNINDAHFGAKPALMNHDRKVYVAMGRHQYILTTPAGVKRCGEEQRVRYGRSSWFLQSAVHVWITVANDQIVVTDVAAQDPALPYVSDGDDLFQLCFRKAVQGLSIPCPGCLPGQVDFNWAVQESYAAQDQP